MELRDSSLKTFVCLNTVLLCVVKASVYAKKNFNLAMQYLVFSRKIEGQYSRAKCVKLSVLKKSTYTPVRGFTESDRAS